MSAATIESVIAEIADKRCRGVCICTELCINNGAKFRDLRENIP